MQEDEQAAPDQLQRLRELMAQEEGEVAEAERAGPEAAEADRRARTCLVEDASEARRVAQLLMGWARDKADVLTGEPLVFGCDTEVGPFGPMMYGDVLPASQWGREDKHCTPQCQCKPQTPCWQAQAKPAAS